MERSDDDRNLYPPLDPFAQGRLRVDSIHELYYEESGNPKGKPVVFVHGGPGGGTDPSYRRFFDPSAYRIVLFDQRGCGQSTPHASLEDNTTWHLVADMERLREHLGIERWQVFGGSWGSTLALAYAETHPGARHRARPARHLPPPPATRSTGSIRAGASRISPTRGRRSSRRSPTAERGDLVAAYHRRLTQRRSAQVRERGRAGVEHVGGQHQHAPAATPKLIAH